MGGAHPGRSVAAWSGGDLAHHSRRARAAIWGIVALSLAAWPTTALAQGGGETAPGTIERQYEDKPKAPRPTSTITVPTLDRQGPPANAEQIRFVLSAVEIDGNTVLSDEQLSTPFASLIGQEVSLAQMFAASNEITRMYVRAGYALSLAFVPAQEVRNGVVRVRVIEGYIGDVEFHDERSFHSKLWGGFANRLMASRPLKTADLERYLLLANDLAGVEVKSVFERMDGDPGATKLVMMIERKMFDAEIEVNNRGSKAIGPYRVQGNAAINNLVGAEERLSLFGVRVPDGEELAYLAGRIDVPLSSDGLAFGFDLSRSHSRVGTPALVIIDYQTDGWTGNLAFTYPYIRSRAHNLYFSAGIGYKDLTADILATEFTHDTMTMIVLGAAYDTHDRWGGLIEAEASLHIGLDVFDATQSDDPKASRAGASGEFIRLDGYVSRLQAFKRWPWLQYYAEIAAQVADGALLVSEQCGYGGGHIGRAYDPFEIAGDHCIKGLAEIRYDLPMAWANNRWINSAQVYGLADFGYVLRSGDLLPGESRDEVGTSLGLGVRWRALDHVSGLVEVVQPVGLGVAFEDGEREARIFFGLSVDY
jgi:hemolysin activation/secretion protein